MNNRQIVSSLYENKILEVETQHVFTMSSLSVISWNLGLFLTLIEMLSYPSQLPFSDQNKLTSSTYRFYLPDSRGTWWVVPAGGFIFWFDFYHCFVDWASVCPRFRNTTAGRRLPLLLCGTSYIKMLNQSSRIRSRYNKWREIWSISGAAWLRSHGWTETRHGNTWQNRGSECVTHEVHKCLHQSSRSTFQLVQFLRTKIMKDLDGHFDNQLVTFFTGRGPIF